MTNTIEGFVTKSKFSAQRKARVHNPDPGFNHSAFISCQLIHSLLSHGPPPLIMGGWGGVGGVVLTALLVFLIHSAEDFLRWGVRIVVSLGGGGVGRLTSKCISLFSSFQNFPPDFFLQIYVPAQITLPNLSTNDWRACGRCAF